MNEDLTLLGTIYLDFLYLELLTFPVDYCCATLHLSSSFLNRKDRRHRSISQGQRHPHATPPAPNHDALASSASLPAEPLVPGGGARQQQACSTAAENSSTKTGGSVYLPFAGK